MYNLTQSNATVLLSNLYFWIVVDIVSSEVIQLCSYF